MNGRPQSSARAPAAGFSDVPIIAGAVALAGLGILAGLLSPAEPTGSAVTDAFWNIAFVLAAMAAASRAKRLPVLWMLGLSALVGVSGTRAGVVFGLAALGVAFGLAFTTPSTQRRAHMAGAIAGLVAAVAIVHGPSFGPVGAPTLVAALAIIPVLISAWLSINGRLRTSVSITIGVIFALTVVASTTAGLAARSIRQPLASAESESRAALKQLSDGETSAAASGFTDAAGQFGQVHDTANGPLGWLGRAVPIVAQHLTAMRDVSAAGIDLATTASEAASSADWRNLTATGGRVNLVAIEAMREPAAAAAAATSDARVVIDKVRSPWLISPVTSRLDSLDQEIANAEGQARLASSGLDIAPALLGGDRQRRYLLALATPGESRNGGGFVGSFGILSAIDGSLFFDESRTTRDLASPKSRAGDFALPPEWETRYGSLHVGVFPGNLAASPSWPNDAFVAGQIAALNPDVGAVDGVLYADPIALAALLELTGPVRVPSLGRDLDSTNVVQYLLIEQYVRFTADNAQRLDALSDVTSAVFTALTNRPLPGLSRLGSVLGPVVAGGHLRLASFASPAEAAFLDEIGLGGEWKTRPGADYFSLRSANMLPTKIDVFMTRDISITTTFDPATGAVNSRVQATITNSAPARGLPGYVIGNGLLAPTGTNKNLLALYSPLEIDAVMVDGISAGAQVQSEFGGWVYSVPVTIAPGASVVVTWDLSGLIDAGPTYRLDVIPPALATPDQMRITVEDADPSLVMDGPLLATERFDIVIPID